jgi:hypothetical protein
MPAVTVTALKNFTEDGITGRKGQIIVIDPPVKALLLHRKGLVSLSKVITRELSADPEPEPKKRRSYRRRDMQAEG